MATSTVRLAGVELYFDKLDAAKDFTRTPSVCDLMKPTPSTTPSSRLATGLFAWSVKESRTTPPQTRPFSFSRSQMFESQSN